ncbi:MAG TPA: response regulator transcription factor [Aggregatilineales bacterium]|nr:response regulator transcription factor [Aggregatilineales bacterium]
MIPSHPIRVALADDHRTTHDLVISLLKPVDDILLVAHASNGLETIAICDDVRPDVLLLDVVMPIMNGIEACERLMLSHPDLKILVLSNFDDDESVRLMLEKGARGYIVKSDLRTQLLSTIRMTYQGSTVLSSGIVQQLVAPPQPQDFGLTERELAVLKLLAKGASLDEIAETLFISRSTVKYHLTNILTKMRVESRAEAITLAARANLV